MSTKATTPSDRGRRNRANGATCERRVAAYVAQWWPDACRAIRVTAPDPGDIDGTSPSLWWSVKDCEAEHVNAWFAEMAVKAGGRIGLLVVRRKGYADPGRWWCWLTLEDLACLVVGGHDEDRTQDGSQVRMELQTVVALVVEYLRISVDDTTSLNVESAS